MRVTRGVTTDRSCLIVLAGGGARRLGGRDKPGLVVGKRTLLESVITAGGAARHVVVVGPRRPGIEGVAFVSEEPPGAGPVAALRRGLAEVSTQWVVVLAADLPFLRQPHVEALLRAASGGAGAVLADDAGRPQWLAGCWRTAALREALSGYDGDSLRGVLGLLEPAIVNLDPAPGEPPPWLDCDTPEDLERARGWA
ncbi:MAG TPA: molybdenum cofactor guanylyltransferase [Streptosporangiaceae bacterium]